MLLLIVELSHFSLSRKCMQITKAKSEKESYSTDVTLNFFLRDVSDAKRFIVESKSMLSACSMDSSAKTDKLSFYIFDLK
jgi:hypothetical protein